MRKLVLPLALALGLLLVLAVGVFVSRAEPPAPVRTLNSGHHFLPPYANPRDRFGFDSLANDPPTNYDVAQLNAGWYTDWSADRNPPHPDLLTYAQLVNFKAGTDPYDPAQVTSGPGKTVIARIAADHPGSLWMLGNETDSIYRGAPLYPEVYAHVYHEYYNYIKGLDPTALIAIGAIVQPTPCRMMYLDIVLDTYQQSYGEPMPVDVWNIHAFVLREVYGSWGASTPPGVPTNCAIDYKIYQGDDVNIFRDNLIAFRQWMKDKGEQNKPLIVSEYGVLWPSWLADEHGEKFPPARVSHFMTQTFDLFLYETYPNVGYPEDDYRLVQAWAWYSLSETYYNGKLFDPVSGNISPMGQTYASYTVALPDTPYADLTIHPSATLDTSPLQHIVAGDPYETTSVTLPVWVYITNMGKLPVSNIPVVAYLPRPVTNTITLPARYAGDVTPSLGVSLLLTQPARYDLDLDIPIVVDPAQTVNDPRRWNNSTTVAISATVEARPDLVISMTAWSVRSPETLSDVLSITLTVANEGVWPAPSVSGTVSLRNAQESLLLPIDRFSIPGLEFGDEVVLTTALALPSPIGALYYLGLEADSDDIVDEPDEENNRIEVAVDARPDLLVSTTDWRIEPPADTDGVLGITLTVVNEGIWPALPVSGALSVDNPRGTLSLPTERFSTPALGIGAQVIITKELTLPASSREDIYLVTAQVDTDDVLDEQDEENNRARVAIPIVVTTTLQSGATGVLTSTSGHMVFLFPTGTVTVPTELRYTPLLTSEVPPGPPLKVSAFRLAAYRKGEPVSLTFPLPVTVTWQYTDTDVIGLDEEELGLYHLLGSDSWKRVFGSEEQHWPELNRMRTYLQELGPYVFGQPYDQYLPLVLVTFGSEESDAGVQSGREPEEQRGPQQGGEGEPALLPGFPLRLPPEQVRESSRSGALNLLRLFVLPHQPE